MGVISKGIPRGCQGLFTPVSLGYPQSVFNKNSTLKNKQTKNLLGKEIQNTLNVYLGESQQRRVPNFEKNMIVRDSARGPV